MSPLLLAAIVFITLALIFIPPVFSANVALVRSRHVMLSSSGLACSATRLVPC